MDNAALFVVDTVFDIACFLFLARLLLQACRADFYNPISQGIVKVTDPVLKPVRSVIPGFRNIDVASFLVAWLIKIVAFMVLFSIAAGGIPGLGLLVVRALFEIFSMLLTFYWWAILFVIILSFLAPGSYHPAAQLLQQLTEPILAPARKLVPPVGGLDFSPILVFMVLILARDYLLPAILQTLLG